MINLIGTKNSKDDSDIPYITLTIPDRNDFIEHLMCYYSVYYISVKKEIKDLIIRKTEKFNFVEPKNNFTYSKFFNIPASNYIAITKLNYM